MLDARPRISLLLGLLMALFVACLRPMPAVAQEQETPTPLPAENTPTAPLAVEETQRFKVLLPLIQRDSSNQQTVELQMPPDDPARGMIYEGLERGLNGPCGFGFQVKGEPFCTHGPDPAPRGQDVRQRTEPIDFTGRVALEAAAVCEGDGVSGNRVQVMYVRASDKPDRYSQYLASIRQWANDADQMYYDSAAEVGSPRRIRFVHDANCVISVLDVVLSSTGDDNFSNTTTQLRNLGHNLANRKYMIFMDANILCGIGGMYLDDSAGANNYNNFGPSYGRTDNGCWGGHTAAHELNHNLGGVQDSAPNTSLGGHCTDEKDVMCYSDSPHYPPMRNVCTDPIYENRLDCNHDDYYHPNPPAGSYLATHWNTANNQFLINTSLPPPTPTPTPTATATPFPGCIVYNSTDVPKTIADLTTVTSNLSVADAGTLTDVNVRNLRIAHTYNSDLNVYLVSPAGTQVELFTAVGGGNDDFFNTWLDDAAATSIVNGAAPFTGVYRPEGLLSALNGQNRNGTWQLRITDTANEDTGQLTAWSLELCSNASTPTPTRTPTATNTPTRTPTRTPTPSNATITIAVDAQPNHSQNFRFTGTLNGSFFLDDDAGAANADATYNSSVTVIKPAASYTVIASAYTNWFLTAITCTPSNAATVNLGTRTVTISATAGATINCTFTQQRASTVRAVKYNDLNNNGARNSNEPYLSGWTMTLYDAQNNQLASGVTDANGRVNFTGRLPGAYKVCETLTPGWINTQPNVLDPVLGRPCRSVITEPGVTTTLNFGNRVVAAAQGAAAPQELVEDPQEGITITIEEDALTESPEEAAP